MTIENGKCKAYVQSRKDYEALVATLLLEEFEEVHDLEVVNNNEELSRILDVDLSKLVNIKTLLHSRIAYRFGYFYPPNLEFLKGWVEYMPTDLDLSLLKRADLTYGGGNYSYFDQAKQRFILCEILQGELLPQIEHLKINSFYLLPEFVNALEKRPGVLKTFEAPWMYSNNPKRELQVLIQKVENLTIFLPDEETMSVDVPNPQLRTLKLLFYGEHSNLSFDCFTGNWVKTHLEELTIETIDIWSPVNEFSTLHALLAAEKFKKLTFLVGECSFTIFTDFITITKDVFFPWPIYFEFWCKHNEIAQKRINLEKRISEARELTKNYYFDFSFSTATNSYVVVIRPNLSWLPHKHIDFCKKGQESLETLVCGITKLKKFCYDKKEKLAHVDPACMEFLFEALQETDFY
jgi:hypothetical protein